MKFLPLVLAGLWRKPTRMVFTALSILVAFILFGILSGIDAGFAHQVQISRLDRMYVTSRFAETLPYAYGDKIASLPGVLVVSPQAGLGGYYQQRNNRLGVTATDARYFTARPELAVTPQQIAALAGDRAGVLVGVKSAKT